MHRNRYGPFSAFALLALVLAMAATASARDNRNIDRSDPPQYIMVAENTTAIIATTIADKDWATGFAINITFRGTANNDSNFNQGAANANEVTANANDSASAVAMFFGRNIANNGGSDQANFTRTETGRGIGLIMSPNTAAQALFVSFAVSRHLNC